MAWKPRGRGSAFSDDVMDDEDDRQLLDILGDVDALNDYLHGNNSKSIEEDDVTNAAYGSDTSFFSTDTPVSNSGLKDAVASDFEPLASSLSFMEEELGSPESPAGGDEPFDILQKSLLEADITEQTLAQEALLDSQPAPTLVQAPVPFPAVAPGNVGGAVGVVTPAGQFIQGVSQLQNGSAQHIQVLSSFGAGGGVMTLSNLERTPQIVLRPPLATPTAAQTPAGGFKNIPLQNIIIQRGPGGTQALVRPIQPKPLHTGAPAVTYTGAPAVTYTGAPAVTYTVANVTNVANGPIVVQSSLEQANTAPGQFLLPGSLALTQNGPTDANANALLTTQNANTLITQNTNTLLTTQNANALITTQNANTLLTTQNTNTLLATQNAVQIVAGGQLILNQVGGVTSAAPAASPAPARLTLVAGQSQVSGSPVQRLLVTQAANCASLSPLTPGTALTQEQSSSSPALKLTHIHTSKTLQDSTLNSQVAVQSRPAPLTRGGMALQQVRSDQGGVLGPPRSRFTSFEDALHRLLPYNVFQGVPPSREQFAQVDEEFEAVAAQVLSKTEAMINKYRKLLFVEAERASPSSEIVMIDRTFNQEERGGLTQDKRTVLVDPDGFLEDFCCGVKSSLFSAPPPPPAPPPAPPSLADARSPDSSPCPSPRTEPLQPPYSDPGGGGGYGANPHRHDLKLKLQSASFSAGHYRSPHAHRDFSSPPQNDTDSALEAAVNSILEC